MDREQPREFFWALMDYGSYLKSSHGARLDQSRHYKKQAPLKGSMREMRGRIIRELTSHPATPEVLGRAVNADERFEPALESLVSEGMIEYSKERWRLSTLEG